MAAGLEAEPGLGRAVPSPPSERRPRRPATFPPEPSRGARRERGASPRVPPLPRSSVVAPRSLFTTPPLTLHSGTARPPRPAEVTPPGGRRFRRAAAAARQEEPRAPLPPPPPAAEPGECGGGPEGALRGARALLGPWGCPQAGAGPAGTRGGEAGSGGLAPCGGGRGARGAPGGGGRRCPRGWCEGGAAALGARCWGGRITGGSSGQGEAAGGAC